MIHFYFITINMRLILNFIAFIVAFALLNKFTIRTADNLRFSILIAMGVELILFQIVGSMIIYNVNISSSNISDYVNNLIFYIFIAVVPFFISRKYTEKNKVFNTFSFIGVISTVVLEIVLPSFIKLI